MWWGSIEQQWGSTCGSWWGQCGNLVVYEHVVKHKRVEAPPASCTAMRSLVAITILWRSAAHLSIM